MKKDLKESAWGHDRMTNELFDNCSADDSPNRQETIATSEPCVACGLKHGVVIDLQSLEVGRKIANQRASECITQKLMQDLR